jgi:hypothetical protein
MSEDKNSIKLTDSFGGLSAKIAQAIVSPKVPTTIEGVSFLHLLDRISPECVCTSHLKANISPHFDHEPSFADMSSFWMAFGSVWI